MFILPNFLLDFLNNPGSFEIEEDIKECCCPVDPSFVVVPIFVVDPSFELEPNFDETAPNLPENPKFTKLVLQCVQKFWGRKFVIFEVFGVTFCGQKIKFSRQFQKIDFLAENFTPKPSKMTKLRRRTKIFKRTVTFLRTEPVDSNMLPLTRSSLFRGVSVTFSTCAVLSTGTTWISSSPLRVLFMLGLLAGSWFCWIPSSPAVVKLSRLLNARKVLLVARKLFVTTGHTVFRVKLLLSA